MSAPVMLNAGRYGAKICGVPSGACGITTGGSDRPPSASGMRARGGPRERAWAVRVRGLVDAFVDAERRMSLEPVRDLCEQLLIRRVRRCRQLATSPTCN